MMNILKVKKIFEAKLAKKTISGGSVILVDEYKTAIINSGIKNKNNPFDYVTDDTLFSIGSITKIFTALLVCDSVVSGLLHLQTTVGEILSKFDVNESFKKITLIQILTHTSGLPRLPENLADNIKEEDNPYKFYGEEQLLEYLKYGAIDGIGKKMVYSNLGYGLLGYMLEKISDKSYSQLLADKILKPLAMNATIVYNATNIINNCSQGYRGNNEPSPLWEMNVLKGAGGILSTPDDMKKYLDAVINKNSLIKHLINESLNQLSKKMAWGWLKHNLFLRLIGANNNLWHNGMTGGFASFIEINKKRKCGFAVLYNKAVNPSFLSYDISAAIPCIGF